MPLPSSASSSSSSSFSKMSIRQFFQPPKAKSEPLEEKSAENSKPQRLITSFFATPSGEFSSFKYLFEREAARRKKREEEEERKRQEEEERLARIKEAERQKRAAERKARREAEKRRFEEDQQRRWEEELASRSGRCIIPNLYLGNRRAAKNRRFLREKTVTMVLNCSKEVQTESPLSDSSDSFMDSDAEEKEEEDNGKMIENVMKGITGEDLSFTPQEASDVDTQMSRGDTIPLQQIDVVTASQNSEEQGEQEEADEDETLSILEGYEGSLVDLPLEIQEKLEEEKRARRERRILAEREREERERIRAEKEQKEREEEERLEREKDIEERQKWRQEAMERIQQQIRDDAADGEELHDITYLRLNVEDKTEENLDDTFDEAHEFIASALERKTSILIHCREGLSRSPTIVISFLMRHLRWDLRRAYDHVLQSNGGKLRINDGFKRQLMRFEEEVRGAPSMDFFDRRLRSSSSMSRHGSSLSSLSTSILRHSLRGSSLNDGENSNYHEKDALRGDRNDVETTAGNVEAVSPAVKRTREQETAVETEENNRSEVGHRKICKTNVGGDISSSDDNDSGDDEGKQSDEQSPCNKHACVERSEATLHAERKTTTTEEERSVVIDAGAERPNSIQNGVDVDENSLLAKSREGDVVEESGMETETKVEAEVTATKAHWDINQDTSTETTDGDVDEGDEMDDGDDGDDDGDSDFEDDIIMEEDDDETQTRVTRKQRSTRRLVRNRRMNVTNPLLSSSSSSAPVSMINKENHPSPSSEEPQHKQTDNERSSSSTSCNGSNTTISSSSKPTSARSKGKTSKGLLNATSTRGKQTMLDSFFAAPSKA